MNHDRYKQNIFQTKSVKDLKSQTINSVDVKDRDRSLSLSEHAKYFDDGQAFDTLYDLDYFYNSWIDTPEDEEDIADDWRTCHGLSCSEYRRVQQKLQILASMHETLEPSVQVKPQSIQQSSNHILEHIGYEIVSILQHDNALNPLRRVT